MVNVTDEKTTHHPSQEYVTIVKRIIMRQEVERLITGDVKRDVALVLPSRGGHSCATRDPSHIFKSVYFLGGVICDQISYMDKLRHGALC